MIKLLEENFNKVDLYNNKILIDRSWKRCIKNKLNPYEENISKLLDKDTLNIIIEKKSNIISIYKYYIKRFEKIFNKIKVCAILTDENGIILSIDGYEEVLEKLDKLNITRGGCCNENVIGTNAPGLSLIEKKPVLVAGEEHFTKLYRWAFCAASPIFDPYKKVIGAVDFTQIYSEEINKADIMNLLLFSVSLTNMIDRELYFNFKLKDDINYCSYTTEDTSSTSHQIFFSKTKNEKNDNFEIYFNDIIFKSKSMEKCVELAKKFSFSDLDIHITGETGTGKELFAKTIHHNSQRKNGPFIVVNCAAIPSDLVESELFGYEKGAFTGAKKEGQVGKFELACGGTIFLDEMDSTNHDIQSKLLRVIETKKIIRLGSSIERPVNVRIISASGSSLQDLVKKGLFRKDLYYRLSVLNLYIPPLRERKDDIIPLIEYFLESTSLKFNVPKKNITEDGLNICKSYSWPGNIRELKHFIERIYVVYNDKETITDTDIINELSCYSINDEELQQEISPFKLSEYEIIKSTLMKTNNDILKASQILKISRSTLYRKIKKYKL